MKKTDISRFTVETEKLPSEFVGYKFIVMSDLHSNTYGIDLHEINVLLINIKPPLNCLNSDTSNLCM